MHVTRFFAFVLFFVSCAFSLDDSEKREIFRKCDLNGDGFLDFDEVKEAIHQSDIASVRKEVERLLPTFDLDKSQDLNEDEFQHYLNDYNKEDSDIETRVKLFSAADKDKNGRLDASEMVGILHYFDDPLILNITQSAYFKQLDTDSDGFITSFEYFETKQPDAEELKSFNDNLDLNKDNKVDLAEYIKSLLNNEEEFRVNMVQDTFENADMDKDKKISEAEFLNRFSHISYSFIPYSESLDEEDESHEDL